MLYCISTISNQILTSVISVLFKQITVFAIILFQVVKSNAAASIFSLTVNVTLGLFRAGNRANQKVRNDLNTHIGIYEGFVSNGRRIGQASTKS